MFQEREHKDEHPYSSEATAAEERFEREREERSRNLSPDTLEWARWGLRFQIAHYRANTNIYFSYDWPVLYNIALEFGFEDIAEDLKNNH